MVSLQPKLNLKVSQRQILTPGLMQMVSVLALNKLELKDMIQAEIVENPVLEELEESVPMLDDVAGREALREAAADEPERERADPFEEIDFGSYFQEYLDPGFRSPQSFELNEKPSIENYLSTPDSLADHLGWQVGSLSLSHGLREAVEYIIGNLDEDGYLTATDEELLEGYLGELIAFTTGAPASEEVRAAQELEAATARERARLLLSEGLNIVRGLDPVGLAARDLRECLLLQIRGRGEELEAKSRRVAAHDARTASREVERSADTSGAREDRGLPGHGTGHEQGSAVSVEVIVADAVPDGETDRSTGVASRNVTAGITNAVAPGSEDGPGTVPSDEADGESDAELDAAIDGVLHGSPASGAYAVNSKYNGHATAVYADAPSPADEVPDVVTVSRLAERIVDKHLTLLQKRDLREVARAIATTVERAQVALEFIRTLDPRPGQRFNNSKARLIEPDVAFVKRGDEYVAVLDDENVPTLRLNQGYRRLLKKGEAEKDVKEYVKERYRSALQLMRNIEQRKNTILRTCEVIVRRQGDFLEHGVEALRPMMIKEVAEEIGVHPSTVSRAVSNKYVHTPQGVFELRFFFSEGVNGPEGSGTPLLLLKRKVKKLIEDEDPRKPLTDDTITQMLQAQGIDVTRRTVAKYREDLRIPSTHQRRVRD